MIGKIRDMLTFEGLAYAIYDYPRWSKIWWKPPAKMVEAKPRPALPHFDFDFCLRLGRYLLQGRSDCLREVLSKGSCRVTSASTTKSGCRNRPVYIDCDGDVRPILPAMMSTESTACSPFEVNGCAHPANCSTNLARNCASWAAWIKFSRKGPAAIKAYLDSLSHW